MKSSLGSHIAGTGMNYSSRDKDDALSFNISKSRQGCKLSTDNFGSDRKGRQAFDDYCKEMSGEVKVYHINELQEA
jgi:hypothetical protein